MANAEYINQLLSDRYRLDMIPVVFYRNNITFSKTMSAKLVGGAARLEKLMTEGKIRFEKKTMGKANAKCHCNGGDVMMYLKY